jgi:hypothetical protein
VKRVTHSGSCRKLGVSAVGVGKSSGGDRRSSDCSSGVTISKGDLVDEVRLLVGKRRDVHVIDARRRRGHGRGGAFDVHWWSAHVVFPGVSFALLATRIGSHWHLHISSMGGMTLVLKRQRLGVATLGLLPW